LLDLIFGGGCKKKSCGKSKCGKSNCNTCCHSHCHACVSACGGCDSCGGHGGHGAPAPAVEGDAAPVPPAPMVDPAAYVPAQRRVVHAGVNLLR
jgi:hypothetical protein